MNGSDAIKPKPTPEERRARKAERRAKQRAANAGRAEKMHRVRMENGERPQADLASPPALNIGCSGWFYWHWRGPFYPSQMPTKEWFAFYQAQFDTVELNAPFYSWPTVNAVKTWLSNAQGHDFVYTVKANELITHIRRFEDVKALIEDFGYIADLLGPRMGCFLFQLPPSVHYNPELLQGIINQLDHGRRNVVEFRHPSWWRDEVFDAFRARGTIFCACSGPGLPDDMIRTADDVYVRFHGTEKWYRHLYSEGEIEVWAHKIRDSGAKRVWAYFNNDFGGHAIVNAQQLRDKLRD